MPRLTLSILALAVTLAGATGPASAATNEYRAEPAAPPSVQRFVVRDLVWNCAGGACVALQTSSRPATDCAALVGHVGAVRSFAVAGRPLSAEELGKCNARAR